MHIRDVTADDAAAISEINREVLGHDFPVQDTRAQLERIVKAPNVVLLAGVCSQPGRSGRARTVRAGCGW